MFRSAYGRFTRSPELSGPSSNQPIQVTFVPVSKPSRFAPVLEEAKRDASLTPQTPPCLSSRWWKKLLPAVFEFFDRAQVIIGPANIQPIAFVGLDGDRFIFQEQILHQIIKAIL